MDEQRTSHEHPHPGDVFYIHYHLLETSYAVQIFPITDGQIFLEAFRGVRFVISVGLSVLRPRYINPRTSGHIHCYNDLSKQAVAYHQMSLLLEVSSVVPARRVVRCDWAASGGSLSFLPPPSVLLELDELSPLPGSPLIARITVLS